MNKIGIDFGTSFCSASWVSPATGRAESIRFNGEIKIPSILYYTKENNEPLVGKAAHALFDNCRQMESSDEVDQVMAGMFTGLKRSMKQGLNHYLPNDQVISHEELIAQLLKYIRLEAEALCFEGEKVDQVVITHPVKFELFKQDMLRRAARIAGFNSVELLIEPVAAAMGYMNSRERRQQGVLVYDFGGGTFDIAFVQFDAEGDFNLPFEADGIGNCGGEDIDRRIYNRWNELAKSKHQRSISSIEGRIDRAFEIMECTKQKELMSVRGSKFNYRVILPPPGFKRLEMALTPDEWVRLIEPEINRTIDKTREMVEKIQKGNHSIDKVILIGGSSQIPLVQERLLTILSVEPQRVMDLDVAVAHGAALYTHRDILTARDVFCIGCGCKISSSNRFCWNCGLKNYNYDIRFNNR